MKHGRAALLLIFVLIPPSLKAADIDQITSIICVSQESKSLVSVPPYAGTSKSDKVVSSYTQWMFDADKQPRQSEIRFLWTPHTRTTPPELKIATTDTNHGTVRLLSQTRHGILAATSGSAWSTNVGWMFAINFKAEHVIATSIFSNLGGGRGQAFTYSCRFDNETPEAEVPQSGGDLG